ncbi:MAG: hypothetical protein ACXAD7_19490 [Candidatus Kariarchaeaceae archaeon]|jgi:DNA-binding PadR family transcriptional regulator
MWLQRFRIANKTLSPVELLVLASMSDSFTSASNLIDQLKTGKMHWIPKRGTIYPVLHRLANANLLERTGSKGMEFKRSEIGTNALLSISQEMVHQVEATTNYLVQIANSLISVDSEEATNFLSSLRKKIKEMLAKVTELEHIAKDESDEWTEISVD